MVLSVTQHWTLSHRSNTDQNILWGCPLYNGPHRASHQQVRSSTHTHRIPHHHQLLPARSVPCIDRLLQLHVLQMFAMKVIPTIMVTVSRFLLLLLPLHFHHLLLRISLLLHLQHPKWTTVFCVLFVSQMYILILPHVSYRMLYIFLFNSDIISLTR